MSNEAITWVLKHPDIINPSDFAVMIVLANYADEDNETWPSLDTLARLSRLNRATIKRRLVDLEKAGLIQRTKQHAVNGRSTATLYALTMPADDWKGRTMRPTRGAPCAPERRTTRPSIEDTSIDTKEETQESLALFDGKSEQPKPSDRFDEFWVLCPKQVDPPAARRAWKAALKKASADVIIAGIKRYADHCRREKVERRFQKTPGPWLNGERWNERLESSSQQQQRPGGPRIVTDGII